VCYARAQKEGLIELGSNCIQGAFAAAAAGATVSHQTFAITSDITTESETMADTTLVLTMPTSDQMFMFAVQATVRSDSGNTAFFGIEDGSTLQPQLKYTAGTTNVMISMQYAGDCDGQEIRLRWFSSGGDSELTLYGNNSSDASQASCQSLEVG